MKKYIIRKLNDAHGPSYEWLMEKANNLLYYAKKEDYKNVARFCENILTGLKNNRLIDTVKDDALTNRLLQALPAKYRDRVKKLEAEPDLVDDCQYMLYWTDKYTDGEQKSGSYPVKNIREAKDWVINSLFPVE